MTTATAAIKATLKWLTTETPNQPPCWVKATATVVALLATYGILVYEFTTETWSLGVEGLYDLNDTLAEHWVSWWCPAAVKPAVKVTAKSVPASAPVVPVVAVVPVVPVAVVPVAVATEVVTEVAPVETVAAEVPVEVTVAGVSNGMIDILTLTAPTTPNRATRRRNRTSK